MKTLAQHLHEQPVVWLQAVAHGQGLLLTVEGRTEMVQALIAQMQQPGHLAEWWRDLPEQERSALIELAAAQNQLPSAVFQRRFGEIRRFGPGRMQHERPWKQPRNVAERLWYAGVLARGFVETPAGLADVFAIPTDLLPLLPLTPPSRPALQLAPAAEPGRVRQGGPAFLDDLGTLLIFVQSQQVWLDHRGCWRLKPMQQWTAQWQQPPTDPADLTLAGSRAALLLHCGRGLGLLAVRNRRQILHGRATHTWLQQSRSEQLASLFGVWRTATTWNDLCVTPGLTCEEGNWRNDPLRTRQAVLELLRQIEPGSWYTLDDWVAAVHRQQPDFQRPDGNYDTWYIRGTDGVYRRGFEHWFAIEGALLRYLHLGPLFWLGLIALAESGDPWLLTAAGRALLDPGVAVPPDPISPELLVTEDFRVLLPTGARLEDRFRVARFCDWEASWPGYSYRISQRALRRAAASGIQPAQALAFLEHASGGKIPAQVRQALARFRP